MLGVEGDWVKVIIPELTGYVHKNYLNIHTEVASGSETFEPTEENLQSFLQMLGQGFGTTPLTPDGNLTLVDDFGSIIGTGKQFVTLVTKAGNYFYLIIDRDDVGNQTVHFLNQVDEEDLFNLMDEEDAKAVQEAMNEQKVQTTQAEETVKPEKEPEKEAADQEVEAPKKKQTGSLFAAAGVLIIVIGGTGIWIFLQAKKKKKPADQPDPDADYREDDDGYDLPEEEDSGEDLESEDE